jgi:hypothetical protein
MRLLLVCLVLAGCSNGDGDDMPGPGPDASPTNDPVTPKTGAWEYNEVTPVSSTCPQSISQGGTGNFGITSSSTAGFHVVPNDGTAPFDCNLTGKAFNCPDRAAAMQDLRPQIDAVLTARAVADGTFSAATAASGSQQATVTCAGTQCNATGAQFPCTFKVNFKIRAR